ncbi:MULTISPECIES: MFS transporter [Streptomyces]|uniref:MFS transporter n=1 Tax=Streptomyces TaxID=1883 RepID=UPI001D15BE84|nr:MULTISPECIES: MFS transporter [Streptomyces]MCC3652799.1 MFS transporter [Streptomyces sp. S07_1.15]WSQ72545.1 MFS transporter [Streptomyces xinghaiensis]
MAVLRDAGTLLRLRGFRRLLAVRLLSQSADGVYQIALAAYVVFSPERQTSAAAIASAMAVLLLPYSLVGPFAGVLLDRWRRRQVLLHGNLLRAALAAATAALIVAEVPDWLFYLSALSVTAVNRFILACLSAALPHVVADERQLVTANALSPTAGTLAATAGGGLVFALRLTGWESDAGAVLLGAAVYLGAALTALRLGRDQLGPRGLVRVRFGAAVAGTARGLLDGLAHLSRRRPAARALAAMALMRFCYGALTVMVLMLCRYAWTGDGTEGPADETSAAAGLSLLGLAVALSGAGYFTAAAITPWAAGRLGPSGWITACALAAAVLEPALGLTFAPVPVLTATFFLGLTTQGAKIATDTVIQSTVDDAFRGRVFSLYDMLFNVAFVGAAGLAAVILPPDGRSALLVGLVALLYSATGLTLHRFRTPT